MDKILYNDGSFYDEANVLAFINDFTRALGVEDVNIDAQKINSVVTGMRVDFPHCDGEEGASPFKKAANFLCHFIGERPILDKFPKESVGEEMVKINNHQNALVGFMFVVKSLHNAVLFRGGQEVVIREPIKVSRHSLLDVVDALAGVTHVTGFKIVSVLLEQMVYKTNPCCQYDT